MFNIQNRVFEGRYPHFSHFNLIFLSPMKRMAIQRELYQRLVGEFYSNEIFSTLRKRGRQKNCKTAVERAVQISIQNSKTVDITLPEYFRDFYLDEMRFHKDVEPKQ